ncbi:poly [ADP-ribose] polymerase tankyrase-like isoform X2 [Neocloeon triangulifer]|nr:poly [ADP-ribose] polymerase tankyrase-like isoform X2 [Neocloeon triangulifer]
MRDDICDDLDGYYVKEMHLFHGTPYAREIAVEGFDQGLAKAKGMFGKGVYFAEHSSKSNNYAFGAFKGCPKHNNKKCEICIRRILICKVALGRIYRTKRTVKYLPEGYHSVKAIPDTGFLLRPEYIIYNDEQVYPSFLIQYTATYKKKPPKVSPYPLYRSLAPPIPTPTVYDITQACSSLSLTQTAVAEDAMWITYLQTMSNLSASAQSYYLYFFD